MKFIKILTIILTWGLSTPLLKAQNLSIIEQRMKIGSQIVSIMDHNFNRHLIEDTVAMYAINFKLSLSIDKTGKAVVASIKANDSLAYKLFPAYEDLSTINYKSLMGSRKRMTLIIPVLVVNIAEFSDLAKHKDKHGRTLIDMKAAIGAALALYSPFPYDNLKQNRYIEPKFSQHNSKVKETNDDILYAEAILIDITNIK